MKLSFQSEYNLQEVYFGIDLEIAFLYCDTFASRVFLQNQNYVVKKDLM